MFIVLLFVCINIVFVLYIRDRIPEWVAWTTLFVDAFIIGLMIGTALKLYN